MKSLFTPIALASLSLIALSPAAHADVMSDGITLSVNGTAVVAVYNPILKDYTFTDVITKVGVANLAGLASESVSTITGTYTDVSGVLGTLAIADVCEGITILGSTTPACSDVSLVATDTGLGNVTGVSGPNGSILGPIGASVGTLTLLGADVTLLPDGNLGVATLSIGSADGNFTFGPPPPANSPVPEPGSLSLMATGLLAAAGAVRRKFMA